MESHYEEGDHCISYPAKSCMLLFSFFPPKIEDKAEHGPMKLEVQKKKFPNECQFNQPHYKSQLCWHWWSRLSKQKLNDL